MVTVHVCVCVYMCVCVCACVCERVGKKLYVQLHATEVSVCCGGRT